MEIQSRPSKIAKIGGKATSTVNENGLKHDECLVNLLSRGMPCGIGFTLMQLLEFEEQTLIYKYMEEGIPIPFHLVMPIWKSVTNSLSICKLINSNCYTVLGDASNTISSLDLEPGRCRRTDGKKWRCSKVVVKGQKYCERHMHRDRGRGRQCRIAMPINCNNVNNSNHLEDFENAQGVNPPQFFAK